MQAAEMMRGTRAVYDLALLICLSVTYVHTLPFQVLPSIPGYIPVYIRHGDQPLEEINPALAEAFHEDSSLSKNIGLDSIPDSPDIDPEENKADPYNVYPVHVRQAESGISSKHGEDKKAIEEKEVAEKHRRKVVAKPVFKVNPLTEEEKKALEKVQIQVNEEVKSPNDMYNSKLNLPTLSSPTLHQDSKEQIFDPVTKFDRFVDEPVQLDSHLMKDLSQLSTDKNAESTEFTMEEEPIKEQPLGHVLANVHKISASPETLLNLEKERIEGKSLEGKSK